MRFSQLAIAAPRARCDGEVMARAERHQTAVAQTLGWAREAADGGDFGDALEWLRVVEVVDGALPPAWERRKQLWVLMAQEQHPQTRGEAKPGPSRGAIGAAA
jgi:hypothetical protein